MLLLLLTSLLPSSHVTVDRVDLLERHTLLDVTTQKPVFSQYIFWRYSEPLNSWPGYHVVSWRLEQYVAARPRRVLSGYRMDWFDGKEKEKRRCVVARWYVETACNWDPELSDRAFVECQRRRELAK